MSDLDDVILGAPVNADIPARRAGAHELFGEALALGAAPSNSKVRSWWALLSRSRKWNKRRGSECPLSDERGDVPGIHEGSFDRLSPQGCGDVELRGEGLMNRATFGDVQ
jgi:hypothetical protein